MKWLTWKSVKRLGQNDILLLVVVLAMMIIAILLAMSFAAPAAV